jgi:hypothetical protein
MTTETNQEIKKPVSLGWENGWDLYPEILTKCRHEKEYKREGKSVLRTTCHICNYYYLTDSSD